MNRKYKLERRRTKGAVEKSKNETQTIYSHIDTNTDHPLCDEGSRPRSRH